MSDCTVLKSSDVLKVDIGVQVDGRICDSAFTMNFEPEYDELLKAVKDATTTGIRVSSAFVCCFGGCLMVVFHRKLGSTSGPLILERL